MKIKWSTYFRELSNMLGWSTNRNIVIFESDDWGSIRIPSNRARDELIDQGVLSSSAESHYSMYDSLESNEDLIALYEVLQSYRDANHTHPIFTALCIVANPDFERIKSSNFEEYHFEPVATTIGRFIERDQIIDLWKEGFHKNLFIPQFHGREHLNVTAWMKALRTGLPKTMSAFEQGVTSINAVDFGESNIQYQAAFDIEKPDELPFLKSVILEGTAIFEQLLGYKASYFVPTNGPFNVELERTLLDCGIRYITLNKFQKEPLGNGKYRTHIHWLGKKNQSGQLILSRNASFEPAVTGKNWVTSCMNDIERAFKWHKPAVISTHRVNYIGKLVPTNRQNGLRQLKALLQAIIKKWPNVEFMSSPELGNLIATETSKRSST